MIYSARFQQYSYALLFTYQPGEESIPLEGVYLGRYRLIHLIGGGGMGEVYLAEDDRIAQQVAIKVIRMEVTPYPDTHSAKEAIRLFEREAKAIARLFSTALNRLLTSSAAQSYPSLAVSIVKQLHSL